MPGGYDGGADYLVHQPSNRQAISLMLQGSCPRVPPQVIKEVEDLVEVFHCYRILGSDLSDDDDRDCGKRLSWRMGKLRMGSHGGPLVKSIFVRWFVGSARTLTRCESMRSSPPCKVGCYS